MNRTRILSVVLSLTLLVSLSVITDVVYADDSSNPNLRYAENLKELGVFSGTDNGFELDREPTRLEGVIMLIRMLGYTDSDINKMKSSDCPFTDVPDWAKKYVVLAYKEKLTSGIGGNKFGSDMKLTMRDYSTFMLKALNVPSDKYNWNNADVTISSFTTILPNESYVKTGYNKNTHTGKFTRGDLALFSHKVLESAYGGTNNNGENMTLAKHLMNNGKISNAKYNKFIEKCKNITTTTKDNLSGNLPLNNDNKQKCTPQNKNCSKKSYDYKDMAVYGNGGVIEETDSDSAFVYHKSENYKQFIKLWRKGLELGDSAKASMRYADIDVFTNNPYGIPNNFLKYYDKDYNIGNYKGEEWVPFLCVPTSALHIYNYLSEDNHNDVLEVGYGIWSQFFEFCDNNGIEMADGGGYPASSVMKFLLHKKNDVIYTVFRNEDIPNNPQLVIDELDRGKIVQLCTEKRVPNTGYSEHSYTITGYGYLNGKLVFEVIGSSYGCIRGLDICGLENKLERYTYIAYAKNLYDNGIHAIYSYIDANETINPNNFRMERILTGTRIRNGGFRLYDHLVKEEHKDNDVQILIENGSNNMVTLSTDKSYYENLRLLYPLNMSELKYIFENKCENSYALENLVEERINNEENYDNMSREIKDKFSKEQLLYIMERIPAEEIENIYTEYPNWQSKLKMHYEVIFENAQREKINKSSQTDEDDEASDKVKNEDGNNVSDKKEDKNTSADYENSGKKDSSLEEREDNIDNSTEDSHIEENQNESESTNEDSEHNNISDLENDNGEIKEEDTDEEDEYEGQYKEDTDYEESLGDRDYEAEYNSLRDEIKDKFSKDDLLSLLKYKTADDLNGLVDMTSGWQFIIEDDINNYCD